MKLIAAEIDNEIEKNVQRSYIHDKLTLIGYTVTVMASLEMIICSG